MSGNKVKIWFGTGYKMRALVRLLHRPDLRRNVVEKPQLRKSRDRLLFSGGTALAHRCYLATRETENSGEARKLR